MLIQKNNPVGIDKPIARFQRKMYDQLTGYFGWSTDDYYSYERVYLNVKDGQRIPELFVGSSDPKGNEYREIYFNDNNVVESYFVVEDERPVSGNQFRATVGMIFQANVRKLFPTIEHRADEECHRQVQLAANSFKGAFSPITGLITGLASYRGLDTRQIQESDMHPCHVFRINFDLFYNYNC